MTYRRVIFAQWKIIPPRQVSVRNHQECHIVFYRMPMFSLALEPTVVVKFPVFWTYHIGDATFE